MIQIFNTILVEPLLNLLVFFYNTIAFGDLGLAIIFLTIFVRLIIYPLSASQIKNQKSLTMLQEKVKEIKKQHQGNKEAQAKAMMDLYRVNKVNPFSSCFSFLIQFPILIAVYQVFRSGILTENLSLYSFIINPGRLNTLAFGFLDLSVRSLPLAILTGVVQFLQTKMLSQKKVPRQVEKDPGAKDESMMAVMNKNMLIIFPVVTVFIGMSLPAGLVFYWFISTSLMVIQQLIIFKKDKKKELPTLKT